MTDYAVTVVSTLDKPVDDIDALIDALADTASASITDSELSLTTDISADDLTAAIALGIAVLVAAAGQAGVSVGRTVEAEALEVERQEAQLSEPNLPDLVGPTEVASILHVSRQRVHQLLAENRHFPPALLRLGSGPLWLRSTIEAFDRTWERRIGRPPTSQEFKDGLVDAIAGPGTPLGKIRSRQAEGLEKVSRKV